MTHDIPFWKMHGAGNDFILVNAIVSPVEGLTRYVSTLCKQRTGIGAEGLIVLHPALKEGHFRMQFFNPDGQEAELCGNGARCVARLANDLDIAPSTMLIETPAGIIEAEVMSKNDNVRLSMPEPRDYRSDATVNLKDGSTWTYAFVNTGVPHVVIKVDDLKSIALAAIGRQIRQHPDFSPHGTNVNFISSIDNHHLHVRTYERGVEAETLACGTGITASAITAILGGYAASPVHVHAASGATLSVSMEVLSENVRKVALTGPACYTFKGQFSLTSYEVC